MTIPQKTTSDIPWIWQIGRAQTARRHINKFKLLWYSSIGECEAERARREVHRVITRSRCWVRRGHKPKMKKCILYVGGLDEMVTEELLHSAFTPFGPLRSVQLPKDFKENKTRGFAFIEFEESEDCAEALDNMDGSELLGKVIRCNLARPPPNAKNTGKAVWTAEDFLKEELEVGATQAEEE